LEFQNSKKFEQSAYRYCDGFMYGVYGW